MRQIIKKSDSQILLENMTYPSHKKNILATLLSEQQNFCAYTNKKFVVIDSVDVEHFNPFLKETPQDGYENWFAVNHKWNLLKGTKNAKSRWEQYQPLLLLTNEDLENRILYSEGYYITANEDDIEAQNLIDYLNLNNYGLPELRQNYINSMRDTRNTKEELEKFLKQHPVRIDFPRALETEFGISLNEILPKEKSL